MRIGIRTHDGSEQRLVFAEQIGASGGSIWLANIDGYEQRGFAEAEPLIAMRRRFEARGLVLSAAGLGTKVIDRHLWGRPGAEQDLENVCRTVRALGEAGIEILIVDQNPAHQYRDFTGYDVLPRGRGGTGVLSFDAERLRDAGPCGDGITFDQTWQHLQRFYDRVLPVAEEAGVTLATHPDDPPMAVYRGIHRGLHGLEGFRRLRREFDSPRNALLFCVGTMAEAGEDVIAGLREFGRAGAIAYVHFRNVRGTVPRYEEVFQDEGDLDMVTVVRTLREVGFDNWIVNDHEPVLEGDEDWGGWRPRSLAWQVGYIRGLLQSTG